MDKRTFPVRSSETVLFKHPIKIFFDNKLHPLLFILNLASRVPAYPLEFGVYEAYCRIIFNNNCRRSGIFKDRPVLLRQAIQGGVEQPALFAPLNFFDRRGAAGS